MSENFPQGPADATVRLPRDATPGQQYGPTPAFPPSYGPYGGYGPPQASGPVRPRLLWIFLAWALFVVLVVAGVGGLAGGIFSTIDDTAPSTTFASGQTVSVALDPHDKPAIYAAADQPTNVQCQVGDGQDPSVTLTKPAASQTVSVNGTTWELLFDVGVPKAATYQVTCEGEGVRFGVGKQFAANAGKIVGGAVAFLALPVVGFLSAVVVTVVVLVRRAGARRRGAA
ncbi:hypothetical protein [Microbispora sp. ATCC PTA-5024]|uniref:hypothetical protein n=1 Tax=Microbispora sp. ATCC PTA-5024 TaxID=316330 RepID=UPI0003DDB8CA|nr:hypothetical protein [Microbispora sp. ATCC PTA-5024]ETK35913.1 hypothetical protein MPTA5024_11800 [Microbispora sp. ATCC PTA-5024]